MTTSEQAREMVHTAMSEHHAYHCAPSGLPSHAIRHCPSIQPALDALTAAIEQRVRRETLDGLNLRCGGCVGGNHFSCNGWSDVEDVDCACVCPTATEARKEKADADA